MAESKTLKGNRRSFDSLRFAAVAQEDSLCEGNFGKVLSLIALSRTDSPDLF